MAKISVVVPIYKVEKWLATCLENILKQSFGDFELILVNDGSPDRCGEIADEYAAKDSRIKVVHKLNGGVSSARNIGIEASIGKYICFIDPDDKISEDFLLKLYTIAEENDCDVVISGYNTIPNNNEFKPNFKLNTVMSGIDLILSCDNIHSNNDLCFIWRNIYKLSSLKEKNIRFNEEISIGEDTIFNLEILIKSKKTYAIADTLYNYTVNNPDSTMSMKYKPNLESSLVLQYKIRKELSVRYGLLKNKQYKKDMAYYYLTNIYRMIINNLKNSPKRNSKEELTRILNLGMFLDSTREIGFSYKNSNMKEYIYYLALKFKFLPILKKELNG
ncbi:Glycosyltransferase involved in cell wall bisynthesis [Paenibacillus sp. 1_12]|uniref:glycosyltransferase n=1 Tax=Paenibacillus sp. 1_12 TaxID=1566278 RepID=UPI0008EC9B36|nr:glycosyltransferase [Paenibacillus sp. 1_12]SFL38937.1 Glycosyltransferase involved in cell wall bisynthesis [Paenibacillus sp. 1_12]